MPKEDEPFRLRLSVSLMIVDVIYREIKRASFQSYDSIQFDQSETV